MRGQALALDDLAESLEISRPAAQKHLEKLLRAGLVCEERQEKTAGRPRLVYGLTDQGRELFPRRYSWFTDHFLAALKKDMGRERVVGLMKGLARDMTRDDAERLKGKPSGEKMQEIVAVMNEIGYEARVESVGEQGESEILACNCVYHHLAKNHDEICAFDTELLRNLSGRDVELAECMVKGGKVCRFRIGRGE